MEEFIQRINPIISNIIKEIAHAVLNANEYEFLNLKDIS
jgi:hypothetical protein